MFRRPSVRNAAVLRQIIGATRSVEPHPSLEVLDGRADGREAAKLFRTLGVAAADLSGDQVSWMLSRPEVADVVANDRRGLASASRAGESASNAGHPMIRPGADGHGQGIKVAVLGTGVDADHPQLAHQFADRARVASFVPESDGSDRHGFGTHACGVLAGRGDTKGVAPDCVLMSAKVLADDGHGYDEWILDGLQWAAEGGARIILLAAASARGLDHDFSTVYERVAAALAAQEPGCLLFAPAGDASRRPAGYAPVEDPAACPSILAVTAVDHRCSVAHFANAELDFARVAFAGPGVDVAAAWPGGGVRALSGTAVAAAHAAGVAAVIWSAHPGWTSRDVLAEMRRRALPLDPPSDYGVGLARA